MTKDCGAYCRDGKVLDEISESRKRNHETLNSISKSLTRLETQMDYVQKAVDKNLTSDIIFKDYVELSLGKKMDKSMFKWIIGLLVIIIGGLIATVYVRVDQIYVKLSNYNIGIIE